MLAGLKLFALSLSLLFAAGCSPMAPAVKQCQPQHEYNLGSESYVRWAYK